MLKALTQVLLGEGTPEAAMTLEQAIQELARARYQLAEADREWLGIRDLAREVRERRSVAERAVVTASRRVHETITAITRPENEPMILPSIIDKALNQ